MSVSYGKITSVMRHSIIDPFFVHTKEKKEESKSDFVNRLSIEAVLCIDFSNGNTIDAKL